MSVVEHEFHYKELDLNFSLYQVLHSHALENEGTTTVPTNIMSPIKNILLASRQIPKSSNVAAILCKKNVAQSPFRVSYARFLHEKRVLDNPHTNPKESIAKQLEDAKKQNSLIHSTLIPIGKSAFSLGKWVIPLVFAIVYIQGYMPKGKTLGEMLGIDTRDDEAKQLVEKLRQLEEKSK